MTREELKSIFDALRNDPQHHLGLGDIRLTIAQQDAILDLFPFKDNSLPPAEGAEEIPTAEQFVNKYYNLPQSKIMTVRVGSLIKCLERFATLHAQRLAEKMVSERLREELMAYDKFLSNTYWGVIHVVKRDEAVDEYLKTRESHESV